MILRIITSSPAETKEAGRIFSKVLDTDDIVLLDGELGAGKTTFISGVAEGLCLKEDLSSPSFTIINIYMLSRKKRLVHADFYRLESIDEILGTGVEDYLYSRNRYIFIEWGSKIRSYLQAEYIDIEFSYILEAEKADDSPGTDTGQARSIIFKTESRYLIKKLKNFKKLLFKNGITVEQNDLRQPGGL